MNSKNVIHAKKSPVRKVSRTELTKVLTSSKGRFCTTTHIDKNGEERTMNVIKSNKPADELGYLQVWSVTDRDFRKINPQTLKSVCINRVHYELKTPSVRRATTTQTAQN